MLFSLFETSTAIVFTQNATEMAELRFGTDAITAGWYTAVLQYAGFFVVPCLGVFIDLMGNRVTIRKLLPPLSVGKRCADHSMNSDRLWSWRLPVDGPR